MWTRDVFSKANRDIIRLFRDTLRKYGCFVTSDRNTLARNLELALSTWHEWTYIEIKQQIRYGGFHPNSRFFVDPKTQLTKPISSQSQQIPQQQNIKNEQIQLPCILSLQSNAPTSSKTQTSRQNTDQLSGQPQQPNPPVSNHIQVSRQITDLMKIYNDDDKKYSGDRYDYLHKKLDISYDFCDKIGLQRENHSKALSIMLTGKASQFYYQYISGRNDPSMQQALDLIKQHFETPKVRQSHPTNGEISLINLQSIRTQKSQNLNILSLCSTGSLNYILVYPPATEVKIFIETKS
ncbi:hypothetical protein K3495_g5768 [Podosphaera aphanis]|nr:hypothetical protein K3495_g5768 [Podosphaera aphanis]